MSSNLPHLKVAVGSLAVSRLTVPRVHAENEMTAVFYGLNEPQFPCLSVLVDGNKQGIRPVDWMQTWASHI